MKKHDCDKTQKQFANWLFADSSAALEFDECQLCHEQYLTLKNSLGQFDQACSVMMPEENYWSGYEAKLWTKLAAENQTATKKINLWRPRWIVPVAAGIVLILLAVLNLSAVKKPEEKISVQVAQAKPQPVFEPEKVVDSSKSNLRKRRFEKPNKSERKDPVRSLNKKPQFLFDPNPIRARLEQEAADMSETSVAARHFERAQMLLRAFRNSRPTESASYDLSYEKNRSRRLLYANILLRREAETRGDWSMEEVLNNLEPLLIDIANLPEHATADDVNPIKERMQKQEIVAKLQFYALPVMAVTIAD